MKMLLTRVGEGTKMVVTGDLKQHDRKYEENGLKDICERISGKNHKRIEYIQFEFKDIERSPPRSGHHRNLWGQLKNSKSLFMCDLFHMFRWNFSFEK
jgi:hypothetical protein